MNVLNFLVSRLNVLEFVFEKANLLNTAIGETSYFFCQVIKNFKLHPSYMP